VPRGGKRVATPGSSYGNRTDLQQPIAVATGEPYGQRTALEAAQRAMPLQNTTNVPPAGAQANPAAPAPAGGAPAPQAPLPGDQPFMRPTERPNEPVTAGLNAPPNPMTDQVSAQLRALYAQSPNNDLLRLIELRDQGF
jgi:hypothetical protein